jgi:hypothetical protein
MKSILYNRIKLSLGTFILVSVFLLLEYLKGGVVTHYLLAREDLPGISNWFGLLTIPLLSWIVASLINQRRLKEAKSDQQPERNDDKVLKRFLAALVFGILISVLWEFNLENILQYLILFPLLIAFFKPVHLPEFLLGFVLGMIYTFGGVLPILIGLVLLTISYLINKLIGLLKTSITAK